MTRHKKGGPHTAPFKAFQNARKRQNTKTSSASSLSFIYTGEFHLQRFFFFFLILIFDDRNFFIHIMFSCPIT